MAREGAKDFWRLVIAFFLPPLGVMMQVGLGLHFWINLALFVLLPFWIPAIVHAMWVITTIGPDGPRRRRR